MKKTRQRKNRGGTKTKRPTTMNTRKRLVKKIIPSYSKDEFTLMTFNIESWLNMISPASSDAETEALKNAFTQFLENSDSSAYPKWQDLKDLFHDVDILCIQEDALMGEPGANEETYRSADEKQENFIKKIGNLDIVASCKSHPYTWPNIVGLYYPGSKLSNTIYSKYDAIPNLSFPAQLTTDLQTIVHPRCWAVSQLKIPIQSATRGKTIFNIDKKLVSVKVATIHLSGGRFDDITSLSGNNYIIKIRQIIELIYRENPDIICGDFNTKIVPPSDDKYFLGLPVDHGDKTRRMSSSEFADFYVSIYEYIIDNINNIHRTDDLPNISILDKWQIWMYGLDYAFKDPRLAKRISDVPFKSVFDNGSAKDTTIFGGTVDNIYYNPRKLNCVSNTVVDGVILPGQRILSDHAPVKATFSLI